MPERELAAQVLDRCDRLDALVNNAGLWVLRRQETQACARSTNTSPSGSRTRACCATPSSGPARCACGP